MVDKTINKKIFFVRMNKFIKIDFLHPQVPMVRSGVMKVDRPGAIHQHSFWICVNWCDCPSF